MGWPGPMTHRQFDAWRAWLALQWDRPSRADWYAMQTACEVRRVLSSKPNSVRVEQFALQFKDQSERHQPADPAQAAQWSKAAWLGALGGRVRVRNPDGTLSEMRRVKP